MYGPTMVSIWQVQKFILNVMMDTPNQGQIQELVHHQETGMDKCKLVMKVNYVIVLIVSCVTNRRIFLFLCYNVELFWQQ